ncbi:hypothetical protein HII36_47955, partial [Nonomuraea sp. NN258]|uniref:hypothetical protein n=1 Tax=Nonomuraea antri TaxID=2730852 RepID=UPI00156A6EA0
MRTPPRHLPARQNREPRDTSSERARRHPYGVELHEVPLQRAPRGSLDFPLTPPADDQVSVPA